MHDLIKKEKLSDLICSYHGVSSAAVPVSFLIQGLFLLSDQTWMNSTIKICFFSLSWEVSFWEMVYLYCDWGDICHQVVTKQSFPGTRGDCTKSAAAEESEKMIEAGWKPGTPQQSWGQSSLKTPLTDLVDAVTVTSVFGISLSQVMFWWDLDFKLKELIDFGDLTVRKGLSLPNPNSGHCECSIREQKRIK